MSTQPRGFIALMSAIIISALLLVMITSASFTGFNSRFNLFDNEMKERSLALAEACVEHTMLELVNDAAYAGDATTTVGADACYTGPVAANSFKTRGYTHNAYTTLSISYNPTSLAIVSWQELPVY